MGQSLALLQYHLVFSTKERVEYLRPEVRERLYPYFGGIVRRDKGRLLAVGGAAQHVHLLLILHPERAVAGVIRDIKANSSRWIHQTWPDLAGFSWQDGYSVFSVSPSISPRVKAYLEAQEKHHRRLSFQDELRRLLKAHGVDYDERYLWR